MKLTRIPVIATLSAATIMVSTGASLRREKNPHCSAFVRRGRRIHEGLVNGDQNHPAVKDGTAQVTVFDGKYDPLIQSNQIDTAITQKFDAIIMAPFDLQASAPPIEKAMAAKIPVIVSALKTGTSNYTSMIIVDDKEGGQIIAEEMAKRLPNGGNVV